MAISRVEKFKEYRKSIISEGEVIPKETIDTTLVSQTDVHLNSELVANDVLVKKLIRNRNIKLIAITLIVTAIIVLLIIFGFKFF